MWVLGLGRGNILMPDGSIDYSKLDLGKPGCCQLRDTLPVGPAEPTGHDPPGTPMGGGMMVMPGMTGMRKLRQQMGKMAMPGDGSNATNASAPEMVPMDTAMGAMSTPLNPEAYHYTVARFKANNPGVWAFHCHIDPHAQTGMFFVLRVVPPNVTTGTPWAVPKGLQSCSAGGAPEQAAPVAPQKSAAGSPAALANWAMTLAAVAAALLLAL